MNQLTTQTTTFGSHHCIQHVLLVDTQSSPTTSAWSKKLSAIKLSVIDTLVNSDKLAEKIAILKPNALILTIERLDDLMLSELINVHIKIPLPVIIFSKTYVVEIAKTVVNAGVNSYIVENDIKNVSTQRLAAIIDIATERFLQVQSLNTELKKTKEKLSERKLIERAKGILMKQKQVSEDEAYSQMRTSAMNQGNSIAELAQRIISVTEILN